MIRLIISLIFVLIATIALVLILCLMGCPIVSAEPSSIDYDPVPLVVYETIIWESADQDMRGQMLVALTIRTRAIEWGMTYDEVCTQKWQYSCHNAGANRFSYSDEVLNKAKEAWHLSGYYIAGYYIGKIKVTHYYNPRLCDPGWKDKLDFVEEHGDHIFMYERR